jgi:hypothetical protein
MKFKKQQFRVTKGYCRIWDSERYFVEMVTIWFGFFKQYPLISPFGTYRYKEDAEKAVEHYLSGNELVSYYEV